MKFKLTTDRFNIIGESEALRKVMEVAQKASATDSTVIIFGESGTGKELIARVLHHNSPREPRAFIPVNCAAIPHDLLESELFGYEKGAFTGAVQARVGRLELAHEGTVFLDEIGDMPTALQVKLLRVLAEQEIDRLGGSKTVPVDIRVIAATNRDLEKEVENGRFREDLFYRLNVIPIRMPPLRERKSDIPLLIDHYLRHLNKKRKKSIQGMNDRAMEILIEYAWPGNIRELANFIERMVVLSSGPVLTPRDLPEKVLGGVAGETWTELTEKEPEENPSEILRDSLRRSFFAGIPEEGLNLKQTMEEFERELILEALEKTGWVKNQAAKLLSLNRTTLVEKLKKLKIQRDN